VDKNKQELDKATEEKGEMDVAALTAIDKSSKPRLKQKWCKTVANFRGLRKIE
jgi:hypothetical protein